MTVKEFIEQNPDATLDMMTPVGFLQLTPEQAAELLQGECVNAHPGDRESWAKVTMEELLPQEILGSLMIDPYLTLSTLSSRLIL